MAEVGRPTKYTPELCEQLVEYFDCEPFMEVERENPKTGSKYYERVPTELPTFERFAHQIGVSVSTLHNWKSEHPEFMEAYTRAQQLQKDILVQNGLNRLYDARFTMFMAVNNTDLVDKKERTLRTPDLADADPLAPGVSDEELEAIIKNGGAE